MKFVIPGHSCDWYEVENQPNLKGSLETGQANHGNLHRLEIWDDKKEEKYLFHKTLN